MNKARLEWVLSGLNQYVLTTAEDLFIKTTSADFDKNQLLSQRQEERLETLYREKSRSMPNKKFDRFSVKKSTPEKIKPQRPRKKPF